MAIPDIQFSQLSAQAGQVFTPGAPINEKDLFAGRLDQVRLIINAINQRGYHAVLFGERGVGKTSLANVLFEFLGDPSFFLISRTNCDASDDYTRLWKKALRDITFARSRPGAGFRPQDITEHESIVASLPDLIYPDDIRRQLGMMSSGSRLLIIFDEYDRLKDEDTNLLMADTIKALSDYAVPATLLIIGVADSVDDLIRGHQSIERALVQIPMPRMSDIEIGEILSRGFVRLGVSANDAVEREIIGLCQGLPYIAHLLGLYCSRAAFGRHQRDITSEDVGLGISKALDQWQQSIKSAYYIATKSPQPGHIFREVLLACALADVDELRFFTAASVRRPLCEITGRDYDIPNFAKHLKDLSGQTRGELLQRVGEKRRIRYRLNSPMLRPYIIMKGLEDRIITKSTLQRILSAQSLLV